MFQIPIFAPLGRVRTLQMTAISSCKHIATTLQYKSITGVPEAILVLIFIHVLQMGGVRHPQPPRYFVMQTRCKIQLINGCKKQVCSDLRPYLANGVRLRPPKPRSLFRNASTMQKQSANNCRRLVRSDLCPCFPNGGGCAPPTHPAIL